ncbi:carbonic anhydrase family protein, partial [uncultured Sphingomonas sp.]|uniref:carbonic anhydrase family protein n=1 Tax=uncultured Sphingomonas sp. TaxID=158754 RepID=UPI0035CC2A4A
IEFAFQLKGTLHFSGASPTPPCSESVDWVVMEKPIQASAAQIAAFERVYPFNARPLQSLNRRFLLRSR